MMVFLPVNREHRMTSLKRHKGIGYRNFELVPIPSIHEALDYTHLRIYLSTLPNVIGDDLYKLNAIDNVIWIRYLKTTCLSRLQ